MGTVRGKPWILISMLLLGACGDNDSSSSSPNPMPGNTVQLASPTAVDDGITLGAGHWASGSTSDGGAGMPVDGLPCAVTGASYAYAHLSIYQNGQLQTLPRDIGVVASSLALQTGCVYPAHTRDGSGKIRFDTGTPLTLGQFFAIWGQPLSSSDVAGITADSITAYVNDNGRLTAHTGNFDAIDLLPNREITFVIGSALSQIPTYRWNDPPPLATNPLLIDGSDIGTIHWPDADSPTGGQGLPVAGVNCGPVMAENYHVHSHVAIVNGGEMLAFPLYVGLPLTCFYEMHTHDRSGLIHIEAPDFKRFTLGQLFAVWGQPLSTTNVAGLTGRVKVYIKEGGEVRRYQGDPADIELTSRREITLQVGSEITQVPIYNWDIVGQ